MKSIHRIFYGIAFICVGILVAYSFTNYYSFIFARKVHGVILSVDRVQLNVSLMQTTAGEKMDPQLFSFAVAIREDNGEILTASAEDRQWAAAQRGLCAEAMYYPYPPWKVMKSGTYFNARLDRLYECPDKATTLPPPPGSSSAQPPASPQPQTVVPPQAPAPPPLVTPTPQRTTIPTH